MEEVIINKEKFQASKITTSHANILIIKAKQGFLGCGYFDIETANKLKEPVAIVTGVKTYEDMLSAKVIRLSEAALSLGLAEGISGREALIKLNC
jgi:uncharacterized protein YunC (DUF1805 family)